MLRQGLSNIARHAHASRPGSTVAHPRAHPWSATTVGDSPTAAVETGLGELRAALALPGGSLTSGTRRPEGTTLRGAIPLA